MRIQDELPIQEEVRTQKEVWTQKKLQIQEELQIEEEVRTRGGGADTRRCSVIVSLQASADSLTGFVFSSTKFSSC